MHSLAYYPIIIQLKINGFLWCFLHYKAFLFRLLDSEVNNVNKKSAELAKKLNLEDRMEVFTDANANFLIKDHKEGFPAKVSVRLINPSKTDIGKVSKQILQEINSNLNLVIKQNQWRSSSSVLDWFGNLEGKKASTFVKFDIVGFYFWNFVKPF